MADIIRDFLERVKSAKDDPQIQAALTAEFAIAARSGEEQPALREALDVAALLHWFNARLLKQMLELSAEEALKRFEALKSLSFVERYRQGESDLFDVHEATRLGWRRQMAGQNADGFRRLSTHSAECFAKNSTPAGRIEYVYHLLCADPDRGAGELLELSRDWISYANARSEDCYALAAVLRELEDTGVVQGRARASTLLVIGFVRELRGEIAQLEGLAAEVLRLAQGIRDEYLEFEAQRLLGSVLEAQGQLKAAEAAFAEVLAISRKLAEQDPSNAGWRRNLAVAHSRMGGVLEAQGQLRAAEAAFAEALAISRRLAEQDPSNAGWQRSLAVAHSRMGGVLEAQGQLKAAEAAFAEDLAISRRLAEQDPSNAGWRRDLAAAHSRMGSVLEAQGQLQAAEAAFDEDLAISRRLAEQDPSNAGWRRDLAVAHGWMGGVLEAQGQLKAAEAAFAEALAISRRLAEQDPSNAGWRRDLAAAHGWMGSVLEAQGQLQAAEAAFAEALAISRRLAEQDPSNAGWRRDLAAAHGCMGSVLEAQGQLQAAEAAFAEALAISRRLAEQDPSNAGWQRGLAVAHRRMGGVLEAQGQLTAAEAAFAEALAISRRLAEQDPSNAGWQRGLAVAHRRMGGVLEAQGQLQAAGAAFAEALAISRRLAEQDPSNAGWRRDLAAAHGRMGSVLAAQGQLTAAEAAFAEDLAISRRLAEEDPSNAREFVNPQKVCDIVMKGGITSGIVYPLALVSLAKEYRFSSIGGTSAGAMAAAAAAAAEYGRRTANGGFVRLGRVPNEVGPDLLALFQPTPTLNPLFNILVAALKPKPVIGQGLSIFSAAVLGYWKSALLGAGVGFLVAGLIAFVLNGGSGVIAFGPFLALVGLAVAVTLRIVKALQSELPKNNFGLCPGIQQPAAGTAAFTDWLADLIDETAGTRDQPKPSLDLRRPFSAA